MDTYFWLNQIKGLCIPCLDLGFFICIQIMQHNSELTGRGILGTG